LKFFTSCNFDVPDFILELFFGFFEFFFLGFDSKSQLIFL
jgi:hypothetical protein